MKARYIRVSSLKQNEARQLAKQHPAEKIYVDKVSGAVPFAQRPQGKDLLEGIRTGEITYVSVSSIDRLGRSTLDVLQTIAYASENGVIVKVDNLGLESLIQGKENPTFRLIVSVLANISEMERATLRERQVEGIKIAQMNGTYKGRAKGTTLTREQVLKKYSPVVSYLKRKKHSYKDIAKLCDCSKNTVVKVHKALEAA